MNCRARECTLILCESWDYYGKRVSKGRTSETIIACDILATERHRRIGTGDNTRTSKRHPYA